MADFGMNAFQELVSVENLKKFLRDEYNPEEPGDYLRIKVKESDIEGLYLDQKYKDSLAAGFVFYAVDPFGGPYAANGQLIEKVLTATPFIAALLIGEYKIAEMLIDDIRISMKAVLGEVKWEGSFNLNMDQIITIETFLYQTEHPLPGWLRQKVMAYIEERYQDGYGFNYNALKITKGRSFIGIMRKDKEEHPLIFKKFTFYSAPTPGSLRVAVEMNMDSEKNLLGILASQGMMETGEFFRRLFSSIKDFDVYIDKLHKYYMESKELETEFIAFLIKGETYLMKNTPFPLIVGNGTEKECTVLHLIEKYKPSKDLFQSILNTKFARESYKAYAFYLGRKLYNEKFNLVLEDTKSKNIDDILGMGDECARARGFGINMQAIDDIGLLKFMDNIERIYEGDEEGLNRNMACNLLMNNYTRIREVFIMMLEKGLVRKKDAEYLIGKVSKKEETRFMAPGLILLLNGEL